MASATFYGICRWIDDNGTMKKSVEVEVTLASGVTYSDHASEDKPTPQVGDPVVWVVTYPKSDDYASMLAGCGPQLPPAVSDLFTFTTKTQGGAVKVCDADVTPNQLWLDSLQAYLDYWFPKLAADVKALNLTPTMKRADVVDAVSRAINPAAPAVPRS